MKKSKITNSLVILSLCLVMLTMFITSCGSSAKFDNGFVDNMSIADAQSAPYVSHSADMETGFSGSYEYAKEEAEMITSEDSLSEGATENSTQIVDKRKIIYSGWAKIQTKEYEKSIELLDKLCEKYGAYFENSSEYGNRLDYQTERMSQFKIRIPVANYFLFKNSVGEIGSVVESGEDNVDITEKYIDIEARLESALIREERVLELLKNAGQLDDILALERELSDIRYEIETMTGSLRKYDSLISYATFNLEIQEVIEYVAPKSVPKTFGERVSQNFKDGWRDFVAFWQDFVVYLSYNIFVIAIWVIIIAVAVIVASIVNRRFKIKKECERQKYIERANELNRMAEQNNKDME